MQEHLNHELYRIDRARRDRRRQHAIAEARAIAGFSVISGALLLLTAEFLRVFMHFDELPMLWPLCWFFLVLGYWLGRSGIRHELTRNSNP
jgi:hypothetical protein